MTGLSFKTRARTIDHLGRGQIADAPTAVSELWKNAFDAYARNVALHVFPAGGPGHTTDVAAIFDDGAGMTRSDIERRWLVLGTESKIEDDEEAPDTFGLPLRPKQGEKGIGRLSVAFLAPATILVSRKAGSPFAALLVDWRLFENPFLQLDDILLPVETFDDADALAEGLPHMVGRLTDNLGTDGSRGGRLSEGWERYDRYEARRGLPSTREAVRRAWSGLPIDRHHLEEWPAFLNLVPRGTAMFMAEVNRELAVWVHPEEVGEEVDLVKERLQETLTGFTDPFADPQPVFDYEVLIHGREGVRRLLGASESFNLEELRLLEHSVEGGFDDRGVFRGKLKAFGQDRGMIEYSPMASPIGRGRDRLGPFEFAIGTFEVDLRRSTHTEQEHARLIKLADEFAGVAVYRDDLRVMPYGRTDADFLGMEERRSMHAGRYFWSHRRSFGRVAFTRERNPALRDKAGREGLVDNRAYREMRLLVRELLRHLAERYFGSESGIRKSEMSAIIARNAAAKAAASEANLSRRKGLREFLRTAGKGVREAFERATTLRTLLQRVAAGEDHTETALIAARLDELGRAAEELRPPSPPAKLGDLEEAWRGFRDDYEELSAEIDALAAETAALMATRPGPSPTDVVRERAQTQSTALARQLDDYSARIDHLLGELSLTWRARIGADKDELRHRVEDFPATIGPDLGLVAALSALDVLRAELTDVFAGRYLPFLSTLEQLRAGINLGDAYAVTEDERAALEDRLRDLQAVAQVGVTVEIIGHEFETLEAEVRRNLSSLPAHCRSTVAYQQALSSHQALADRLRFLAPMQVAGYRPRERITGEKIAHYVEEFFGRTLSDRQVTLTVTSEFRDFIVTDQPARIYPVFLNLINNALFWVAKAANREICLDRRDQLVIVADSGPGVDRDDVPRLFELFFTKRRSGRGVGLFLSRANLGVAGHRIRYARPEDPHVLSGANFIIEFRGLQTNA
ncbi:ATP-binding protein [Pararoseomonas indoligenes]|uniref:ATP-binding protein n=1 Tax=Roseomonas indoligenes TaxID=2820811 RepID=A0A940SAB4_9PROT|nr:ATP-binding protein [Pararoseomonas indoligenes]MBP0496017.1 ATP-binding protein [Pararoseomonas indoligenes]